MLMPWSPLPVAFAFVGDLTLTHMPRQHRLMAVGSMTDWGVHRRIREQADPESGARHGDEGEARTESPTELRRGRRDTLETLDLALVRTVHLDDQGWSFSKCSREHGGIMRIIGLC